MVDGDADDVGSRPSSNSPHGAANAAAYIENAVTTADFEEVDGHLLVDAGGVLVGLSGDGGGEVEALAPTPLVDIGHKIVEGIHEMGYFVRGLDLFGATEKGPVLLVFVLDLLARDGAAGEVDGSLPLLLGRAQNADKPVEGEP